ncbi:MAG: hypothetical protein HQK50_18170 [Oligoflexia bacterium]|nr:hypothetical protein [Oligoflexia bacterium]MBF0367506.1 hypothetical protein [Oligoflexia bacterium]
MNMNVASTPTPEAVALRKLYYDKRRPWMILLKGFFLLVFLWVFIFPYWGVSRPEFFLIFYIPIILFAFIYALWRQLHALCPHCQRPFFLHETFYYNPFANCCQHCGQNLRN